MSNYSFIDKVGENHYRDPFQGVDYFLEVVEEDRGSLPGTYAGVKDEGWKEEDLFMVQGKEEAEDRLKDEVWRVDNEYRKASGRLKDIVSRVKQVESSEELENISYDELTEGLTDEEVSKMEELSQERYGTTFVPSKLYSEVTGTDLHLFTVGNKSVRANTMGDAITLQDRPDAVKSIREVVEWLHGYDPDKSLNINVRDMAISVAGDDSFTIGIPSNESIRDIFTYDTGVRKRLIELEEEGVDSQLLWAGYDVLHEYVHTTGVEDEELTDEKALPLVEEMVESHRS